MKTTKNYRISDSIVINTIKLLSLCLLIITSSCMITGVRGNRNVVTENRSISSNFDAIHISHGIELDLSIDGSTSLIVEADENIMDLIRTEVENGVLRIYTEENIWSSKARIVHLSADQINKIKATSGASVHNRNTLRSKSLELSATSGANLSLLLEVDQLDCSTTSGSDISLKGMANHAKFRATSGSNLRAKNLTAKSCDASVTSGANVSLHATDALEAKATSGGNISYDGSPTTIQKKSSSGGSIRG